MTITYNRLRQICEFLEEEEARELSIAWLRDHIPPELSARIAIHDEEGIIMKEDPAPYGASISVDRLDPDTIQALREISLMAHNPDVAEWLQMTAKCLRD
jgi:hypothetical protein